MILNAVSCNSKSPPMPQVLVCHGSGFANDPCLRNRPQRLRGDLQDGVRTHLAAGSTREETASLPVPVLKCLCLVRCLFSQAHPLASHQSRRTCLRELERAHTHLRKTAILRLAGRNRVVKMSDCNDVLRWGND